MNSTRPDTLAWDSEFFGIRVGRLFLDESLRSHDLRAALEQYDLLYIFGIENVSPTSEQRQLLEGVGAKLVDEKLIFRIPLAKRSEAPALNLESVMRQPASENLIELAREAGHLSRFRSDPHFPPGAGDRLYRRWLESSLDASIADEVFVSRTEGRESGLVTLKAKDGIATIGLIAVDARFRKRGIGKILMSQAMAWAQMKGCQALDVATQAANQGAVSLYSSCQGTIRTRQFVYHLWARDLA